jgi:hypothetical protein
MAVKYDEGGYTPPKPPKPVTYPWQQPTQTPQPVRYASTPTPRPQQTPRPASTPTPPGNNPLGNILGAVNNWIWRNNPQKVAPVQLKSPYPTFKDWMWRNNPGRFNPNTSTGRAQMQTYASSGASQDPRNNPAFWRSAPNANSTPQTRKVDNSPNYFNSPWLYGWGYKPDDAWNGSKYRMWPAAPTPTAPPTPPTSYGDGWGYGGGGGGGYTSTPYLPQWYMNSGLWRI